MSGDSYARRGPVGSARKVVKQLLLLARNMAGSRDKDKVSNYEQLLVDVGLIDGPLETVEISVPSCERHRVHLTQSDRWGRRDGVCGAVVRDTELILSEDAPRIIMCKACLKKLRSKEK